MSILKNTGKEKKTLKVNIIERESHVSEVPGHEATFRPAPWRHWVGWPITSDLHLLSRLTWGANIGRSPSGDGRKHGDSIHNALKVPSFLAHSVFNFMIFYGPAREIIEK